MDESRAAHGLDLQTILLRNISDGEFPAGEKSYLSKCLLNPAFSVESLWQEMDGVWDSLGLYNERPLSDQPIAQFYSHPVWLLNGLFTQADPTSRAHRVAIAKKVASFGAKRIADYGGGFGVLALAIHEVLPDSAVEIIEPFPKEFALRRVEQVGGVSFKPMLQGRYDCVIAQDVLEHVEDPILLASELVASLEVGGYAIFANCFYPVIKCHLPVTFHLRHTFAWVVGALGLEYIGRVPGAEHALLFRRRSAHIKIEAARRREHLSRLIGPSLNAGRSAAGKFVKHPLPWAGLRG